ncbi:MAG: RDD family protein [Candidatus Obscuribacterales bacterium]|jgi:uncharacterized RDD family membrane protein YckC
MEEQIKIAGPIGEPASASKRLCAAAIDVSIMFSLWLIFSIYFAIPIVEQFLNKPLLLEHLPKWGYFDAAGFLAAFTIPSLYLILFESSRIAATPGKFLLKLKVVPAVKSTNTLLDGLRRSISIWLIFYLLDTIVCVCADNYGIIMRMPIRNSLQIQFLILFAITGVTTYPAFRGKCQSLADLVSDKFVVIRDSASAMQPPEPSALEKVIRKSRHISSLISWLLLASVLFLAPLIPLFAMYRDSADSIFVQLLIIPLVAWPISIFACWKYRKKMIAYFAIFFVSTCLITLLLAFFVQLPDSIMRVQSTPKVVHLVNQAMKAKQEKNLQFASLCQQAREQESFASSYLFLQFVFLNSLNLQPDKEEFQAQTKILCHEQHD